MAASETVAALGQAADGLLYMSDTDTPWAAFAWPTATGEPTADDVRKRGRHKPGSPVCEQTVDDFFTPLTTDQDWYEEAEKATAAKYRALLAVVKQRLANPRVIRIGSRKVTVYVVGTAAEGGWAGLKTTAVET